MSRLNPWSWNPSTVDRWELRIAGAGRWLVILVAWGASTMFLIWFGLDVVQNVRLSEHGVVVTATVADVAPDGRDTQYLLSYVAGGQPDTRWTSARSGLKVGDTVPVLVDPADPAYFEPASFYRSRWAGYVVQIVSAVAFGLVGAIFLRTDASSFRRAGRARYGQS